VVGAARIGPGFISIPCVNRPTTDVLITLHSRVRFETFPSGPEPDSERGETWEDVDRNYPDL